MQHVKHPEITNKPKPAPALRLGSSPSLAMAVKLIADFYCTTPERIKLTAEPSTDAPSVWGVSVGDKVIPSVIVAKTYGRFVFQTKAV